MKNKLNKSIIRIMKKKCNWCKGTTNKSREDFAEIGWSAVQFGKDKMVCACPKHEKEMNSYIMQSIKDRKSTVVRGAK